MESEILEKMQKRIVRDFLDVFILVELGKGSAIGCHDIIAMINERFYMLLSPATVYSYLHSLERDELIEGKLAQRRRVYILTEKGRETASTLLNMKNKILGLLLNLFIGA